MPSVIAGRIVCLGLSHRAEGRSLRILENTRIRSAASTKFGIETPTVAKNWLNLSIRVLTFKAQIIPVLIPSTIAVINANIPSSADTGNVNDIIAQTFPVSSELGILGFITAIVLGISTAIISALKVNTLIDRLSQFFATVGVSIPNFVLAALLILVFSNILKLLPSALWESPRHTILPAITLGIGPAAYISRLVRGSIIETMNKDYIKTARSKGLSEPLILFKHILKNALSPVVTILGPLGATLITGSFIVE